MENVMPLSQDHGPVGEDAGNCRRTFGSCLTPEDFIKFDDVRS